MPKRKASYRNYDFETRLRILRSGTSTQLDIPRSTARYWLKKGCSATDLEKCQGINRGTSAGNRVIEKELARLRFMVETVKKITQLPQIRQMWKNLERETANCVVAKIRNRPADLPQKALLETLGISNARLHTWRRLSVRYCSLNPIGRCQKRWHTSLSHSELATLKHLHTSPRFRHFSIRSLVLYAKRENLLYCSASTWQKQAKLRAWERPHPYKSRWKKRPGLRVSEPNELWHVDTTYFKLGNGKTLYFQAVVDNFSRYIIAWKSSTELQSINTVQLLRMAQSRAGADATTTKLLMDRGPENRNKKVDEITKRLRLRRMFAGVDIKFSNSMVEAVFRSMKGRYLNGKQLYSERELRRELLRFVREHNEVVPHAALLGGTPSEVFKKEWGKEQEEAIYQRQQIAWGERKKINGQSGCTNCTFSPQAR